MMNSRVGVTDNAVTRANRMNACTGLNTCGGTGTLTRSDMIRIANDMFRGLGERVPCRDPASTSARAEVGSQTPSRGVKPEKPLFVGRNNKPPVSRFEARVTVFITGRGLIVMSPTNFLEERKHLTVGDKERYFKNLFARGSQSFQGLLSYINEMYRHHWGVQKQSEWKHEFLMHAYLLDDQQRKLWREAMSNPFNPHSFSNVVENIERYYRQRESGKEIRRRMSTSRIIYEEKMMEECEMTAQGLFDFTMTHKLSDGLESCLSDIPRQAASAASSVVDHFSNFLTSQEETNISRFTLDFVLMIAGIVYASNNASRMISILSFLNKYGLVGGWVERYAKDLSYLVQRYAPGSAQVPERTPTEYYHDCATDYDSVEGDDDFVAQGVLGEGRLGDGPFAENIVQGTIRLFSTIFGEKTMGQVTLESNRVKRLENMLKAGKSLQVLFRVVVKCCEVARDLIASCKFGIPLDSVQIASRIPTYSAWMREVISITAEGKAIKEIACDPDLSTKVIELKREGEEFLRELMTCQIPPGALQAFKLVLDDLRRYYDATVASGLADRNRISPFVFYVFGGSNKGKSTMTQFYAKDLMEAYEAKHPKARKFDRSRDFYVRNEAQDHWDGYKNQRVVLFDDFLQSKDVNDNIESALEMVRVKNNAPYPLKMAALESKGCTKFTSQLVIVTSNTNIHQDLAVKSREAIRRRRDVIARVTIKPEFQDARGGLDPDKVQARCDEFVHEDGSEVNFLREVYEFHLYTKGTEINEGVPMRWPPGHEKAGSQMVLEWDQLITYSLREFEALQFREARLDKELDLPRPKIRAASPTTDMQSAESEVSFDLSETSSESNGQPYGVTEKINLSRGTSVVSGGVFADSDHASEYEAEGLHESHNRLTEGMQFIWNYCLSIRAPRLPEDWSENLQAEYKKVLEGMPTSEQIKQKSETVISKLREHFDYMYDSVKKHPGYAALGALSTLLGGALTVWGLSSVLGRKTERSYSDYEFCPDECCEGEFRSNPGESSRSVEIQAGSGKIRHRHLRGFMSVEDYNQHTKPANKAALQRAHAMRAARSDDSPVSGKFAESFSGDQNTKKGRRRHYRTHKHAPLTSLVQESLPVIEEEVVLSDCDIDSDNESWDGLLSEATGMDLASEAVSITNRERLLMHEYKSEKVAQGSLDTNALTFMRHTLFNNMVRVTIGYHAGDRTRLQTQNGLFIKGTVLLATDHLRFHVKDPSQAIVRITWQDKSVTEVPYTMVQVIPNSARDCCLYVFPTKGVYQVQPMTDITRHFISDKDLGGFVKHSLMAMLEGTDHPIPRYHYLSDLVVASKVNYGYTLGGEAQKMRLAYALKYSTQTVGGDCGAPIVVLNTSIDHKIMGIHVAGSEHGTRGAATIVSKPVIDAMLECVKGPQTTIVMPDLDLGDAHAQGVVTYDDPVMHFGCVAPEFQVRQPQRTSIRPSPIHGQFTAPVTKPAMLRPEGDINPMRIGVVKQFQSQIRFPVEAVEAAVWDYENAVLPLPCVYERRILTDDEVLNGVDGNQWVCSMNMKTSVGWPYTLLRNKKGKQDFVDMSADGRYTYSMLMAEKVLEREEKAKIGIIPPTFFVDTLKDERRPIAKVDAGKTRVFNISPFDFNCVGRKYFGMFIAFLMDNHLASECSVGVNPHSQEWSQLLGQLNEIPGKWIGGDFSEYDKKLPYQLIMMCCDIINKWYNDGPDNARIRKTLFETCFAAFHLNGRSVYRVLCGNPSGIFLTVIINSMVNSLLSRICWVILAKRFAPEKSISDFRRDVRIVNFGDDNLGKVSIEAPWYNMVTIARVLGEFGMVYTPPTKGEIASEWLEEEERSYLKRGFRVDGPHVFAPLAMDSINEMLNWIRECPEPNEALLSNVRCAKMEAFHYGREFYERFAREIDEILIRNLIPPETFMYEDFYKEWSSGTAEWDFWT